MAASRVRNGDSTRPLNAISHIAYGGPPPAAKGRNGVNTLIGFGLHLGASLFWAAIHQTFLPKDRSSIRRAIPAGAGIASLAYVVDYHVVCERFRPGFEAELSSRALFGVYACFGLGLALGEWLSQKLTAKFPERPKPRAA